MENRYVEIENSVYESVIEKLLEDLFKDPDMSEDDWNLFKSSEDVSISNLVEDMKQGVRNGYSIEFQLDLIKIAFNKR